MQIRLNSIFAIALIWLLISSCDSSHLDSTGKIRWKVNLKNQGNEFYLDSLYANEIGQKYLVDVFKVYLSNFKLFGSMTNEHTMNEYKLLSAADSTSLIFETPRIPLGSYHTIEIAIGVDSAANHSTAHVGDLSPTNDMAWNWNTGYKFVKLEGYFLPEGGGEKPLIYHIGEDRNFTYVRLQLIDPIVVDFDKTPTVEVDLNIDQLFYNPYIVDFTKVNESMVGPYSDSIAMNFKNGFLTLGL
ncbi:MbnP family protein [Aureibacter tunicatorum]|uniref:Copper-binding protein MbnP-like domain-containing protein n=1 Tax=Aureibacter tunicatorum TaxID=866807 RepID=A0AAE3XMY8_9BACT|nr:MbnP family protein [Aureibacter tunicatorum]MDR6239437.1 hypothetical protein [Aureibacter tunicatorum]BDD04640.1 hypothetical protein AUTU_21230 [Aureibacter tunicatorum]